jgi:uncharacterized membrane protein
MKFEEIGRRTLNNLLQGVLYVAPISVTVYAVYMVFNFLDSSFAFLVPNQPFPGMGILLGLVMLIIIGYLGSHFLNRRLVYEFDRLIERAPLIKVIYFSVRDLLSTFVDKKKRLGKPVLVLVSKELNLYRAGFVTQKNLSDLGLSTDYVSVYFPHSYAFSGELYIAHKDNITEVPPESSATDVMKFIVSGGVTKI